MGSDTRPALVADFHRFYGLSLSRMHEWQIPIDEVADMAMHLPLDSAVRRALDPHWQRTNEIDLLREIEHNTRIVLWQNAGKKNQPVPERIPLPWDPADAGTILGDRMTLDEADKWLGWDKRREAQSDGRS